MLSTRYKKLAAAAVILLIVIAAVCAGIFAALSAPAAPATGADLIYRAAQQMSVTASSAPQNKVYLTFTLIDQNIDSAKIVINKAGEKRTREYSEETMTKTVLSVTNSTIDKEDGSGKVSEKVFYNVTLDGLSAKTNYEYYCVTSDGDNSYRTVKYDFWTASEKSDGDEFSFIYMTDTQASGSNAKAITYTSQFAKAATPDAKFLYIAGDLTDIANNEGQWEALFNAPGNSQEVTASDEIRGNGEVFSRNRLSNYTLVVARGNHDSDDLGYHMTFDSHITENGEGLVGGTDKVVYAFDYGSVKFIILNLEACRTQGYGGTALNVRRQSLARQQEFLKRQVKSAKDSGQWTAVGFHKSLYTGAKHLVDDDVIQARKEWARLIQDLDVDTVLQGHDHVLSRGQIKDGYKASAHTELNKRRFADNSVKNAPLYYVANSAGTLKFFDRSIRPNYVNGTYYDADDPLAYDYGFLDISSAFSPQTALNPYGPCTGDGSMTGDDPRYPAFIGVTVSKGAMNFKTHMYGFKTDGTLTGGLFLYDDYTYNRK